TVGQFGLTDLCALKIYSHEKEYPLHRPHYPVAAADSCCNALLHAYHQLNYGSCFKQHRCYFSNNRNYRILTDLSNTWNNNKEKIFTTMIHEIEAQWMGKMQFNALVNGHTLIMDAPERVGGEDLGP